MGTTIITLKHETSGFNDPYFPDQTLEITADASEADLDSVIEILDSFLRAQGFSYDGQLGIVYPMAD